MTDKLTGADHRTILYRARGYADPYTQADAPYSAPPAGDWIKESGTLWKDAGTAAITVAKGLETARDQLMGGGHGSWTGKAADEFKKKLEQVIWFAKEIANRCDSNNPKPTPPAQDGQVFQASDSGSDGQGYLQLFNDLGGYVEGIQNDDKLPPPKWHNTPFYIKWWATGVTNGSIHYEIRQGSSDGEILQMPKPNTNDLGRDSMYDYYSQAGIKTETSEDGYLDCQMPAGDRDFDALFHTLDMNKDQRSRCQQTATDLTSKYTDIGGKFPQPAQAPQIPPGSPDTPGTGGGGGGGGGGGSVGGAPAFPSGGDVPNTGAPEHPHLPDHPGLPDSDGDGIPDSHDPTPHGPTGGGDLPDTDGDGIPDSHDPFPNDPDHNHDGIPDGRVASGSPGDIDTGTETARAGAGGGVGPFGGGGGGVGGGSAGIGAPTGMHGGGPAGSTSSGLPGAAGTAGAGVSPGGMGPGGLSGGPNSTAAGMRGGGMMPMMGGGAGQDGGQEQERNTWLDEDEDVWGADGDAPPPVIGG